jgi:hypothetical protein
MRASDFLLGMLLLTNTALAQEEAPPSMELLEFLGEWGDTDAAWIEQELDGAAVLAGEAQSNEESNNEE